MPVPETNKPTDLSKEQLNNIFASACKEDSHKVVQYYDNWSQNYDKDSQAAEYRGPAFVANHVQRYINDKSARIMDICAGTGAGAVQLIPKGYTNLDALDGSKPMLDVAKSKKLYKNYFCEFLHGSQPTSIPGGAYDAVIVIGSFLGGHLLPEVNNEFLRLLKPGGYCIIGNREQWLLEVEEYKDKLEPYMLCMKGWTLQERIAVPNWFDNFSGIIWVFQKSY